MSPFKLKDVDVVLMDKVSILGNYLLQVFEFVGITLMVAGNPEVHAVRFPS